LTTRDASDAILGYETKGKEVNWRGCERKRAQKQKGNGKFKKRQ